jgi:hypothetical protein
VTIKKRSGVKIPIIIDYDNLLVRCRFCWSTRHQVKNCKQLKEIKARAQGNKLTQGPPSSNGETKPNGRIRKIGVFHHQHQVAHLGRLNQGRTRG